MLELLRQKRVEEFEGCGIRVKFAFTAFLPERSAPRPTTDKDGKPVPLTTADKLRARLGTIDEAIAAGIGDL